MINLKLIRTIIAVPSLMVGQFMSVNVPQITAALEQNVDAINPIHHTNSLITISNPVSQRSGSKQTEVSFCISGDIPSTCFTATDLAKLPRTTLTLVS